MASKNQDLQHSICTKVDEFLTGRLETQKQQNKHMTLSGSQLTPNCQTRINDRKLSQRYQKLFKCFPWLV